MVPRADLVTGAGDTEHSPPFPTGFLIVDKPAGWTSHDVVARVRRLSGIRRVGHAGTLDPAATGVLPLGIGPATRVLEYLSSADKSYDAVARLGVATDTDDAAGRPVGGGPIDALTEDDVRRALARFVGEIEQIPPAYSAIKRDGVPLYRSARAGKDVERQPRTVHVHAIDAVTVALPEVRFSIRCSKGTYVRAIARDLGVMLGCGAHLAALRRTATGGFTLDQAQTMEQLTRAADEGTLAALVLPADRALLAMPAVTLDSTEARRLVTGRTASGAAAPVETLVRAYDGAGRFLGVARVEDEGRLRPEKILAESNVFA